MGESNAEGETYWTALDRALRTVIPQLQGVARVGMAFFPRGQFGRDACSADPVAAQPPTEDLARLMREFPPGPVMNGGTPTYEGLLAAATMHRARQVADPLRARFVVLVTDGAAGCNFEHSLDRCVCLSGTGDDSCRRPPTYPGSCLDDERITNLIRLLRSENVSTTVLGLTGASPEPRLVPIYERFLADMALAGGLPSRGPVPYLRAERRVEIEQSLARPLLEAALCRVVQRDDRQMQGETLIGGGSSVARDTSRRDGWDWADESRRTIQLYGAACDLAIERRVLVWTATATGLCQLPP
ncbi:MAG: VWA domain-containing protein [Myxococcales bacterium]|nr:VWA domain-containing protein [Myxococcales bacterium]